MITLSKLAMGGLGTAGKLGGLGSSSKIGGLGSLGGLGKSGLLGKLGILFLLSRLGLHGIWATVAFFAVVIAVMVGIIYMVYRYRMRRIKSV